MKIDNSIGDINERVFKKVSGFNEIINDDNSVVATLRAGGGVFRGHDNKRFSQLDYILASTFPIDYDFLGLDVKYVVGMSVPPVMIAQIAEQIKKQWLGTTIEQQ